VSLYTVYLACSAVAERCLPAQVSMTMTTSMQRSQIVIPAQGLIEIRDTLTDLLKEYGTDDKGKRFCDKCALPVNI